LRRLADVEAIESRLRDPDNRQRAAVDLQRLPDDPWIAAKAGPPERVAEHRNLPARADAVIVWSQEPAGGGLDAQHRKIGAGDQIAVAPRRAVAAPPLPRRRVLREHARDRLFVIARVGGGRVRHLAAAPHLPAVERAGLDLDDLARVLDRQ